MEPTTEIHLTDDELDATRAALILQSDKLSTQLVNQRMTPEAENAARDLRDRTEAALAKVPVKAEPKPKPKRKSTAKKTSSSS